VAYFLGQPVCSTWHCLCYFGGGSSQPIAWLQTDRPRQ